MIVYVQNDPYKKSGLGTLVFTGIACFFKRKRAIPSFKRANSFFTLFVKSDESKSLFPKEGITPVTLYLKSKWFYPIALSKWATRAKEQIPNPVKNDLYSIKNDLFKICPYKSDCHAGLGKRSFQKNVTFYYYYYYYIYFTLIAGSTFLKQCIIHNERDYKYKFNL